ncbi:MULTISPECIES: GHMP kinase [Dehalococcoides]|uniref:GHMP kinase n=1 Tax=Dehalococcoides mccartyi TaxID=61435 RepID=A0AB38ZBU6_9CHLR|nr:GHMP kinase [Dehalococcoides mccartyi]WRO08059.1 GHMP kinase [Dehalococcoides mccartyi]
MIISRTPFRISFAGGGTDLKAFYSLKAGEVVSTAINKYMYITVNKRFDSTIRVSYSSTEIVNTVDEICHPIVREALKLTGISGGIEIVSIADIPAGTGLGSSSTFTVGLLNALYAYQGKLLSAEELARQACRIEIDCLKEPIGKQDQYIAAYGGICYFRFEADEYVGVSPLPLKAELKANLNKSLLLFYTGSCRQAGSILAEQQSNTTRPSNFKNLTCLTGLAASCRECLLDHALPEDMGNILHKGWLAKKNLSSGISNPYIDQCYQSALSAGAYGGKLLGAGGGGFLLVCAPPKSHDSVRRALSDLPQVDFEFEPEGSKIIYVL